MQRLRFARANHALVPETSAARDRFRRSALGRIFVRVGAWLMRLSGEGLQLFVLALGSSIFAFDVMRTQIYVAWGALAGLLAASWVASWLYPLPGVTVRAVLPRRFALATPTKISVVVQNDGDRDFGSLRLRGPFLPWDGEYTQRATGLPHLGRGARATFELETAFHQRGEHHLDAFHVQALVPFGLAMGAPISTNAPRFLVVPRIATIASLSLPRTRRHHSGGVPRAMHTADSRELAGVRPYRPGDAMRDLHVRTWARTGLPFVREYQEEYFTHVAVVVDAASVSENAGVKRTRSVRSFDDEALEAALSLAAGVIANVLGGEALVDLVVIGESRDATPLGRGRGALEVALDRLATVARGKAVDVEEAVAPILGNRDRLSSVALILSGWDEQREALVHRLEGEGMAVLVVCVGESQADRPVGVSARAVSVSAKRVLGGEAVAL